MGSVIVLAISVREFLLGISRVERELLCEAMMSDLGEQDDRVVPIVDSSAWMKELCGYAIYYRPLTRRDKSLYGASNGYFVVKIKPIWLGLSE
jgi:hypothetical protein